jgi:hypothetical protein
MRYALVIGYGLAMFLFWISMELKEDLGKAKEECNTRVAEGIVRAEKAARETLRVAHERRLRDIERQVRSEREARLLADLARSDAEDAAIAAQETIKRLTREAEGHENPSIACLARPVPQQLVNSLRD